MGVVRNYHQFSVSTDVDVGSVKNPLVAGVGRAEGILTNYYGNFDAGLGGGEQEGFGIGG